MQTWTPTTDGYDDQRLGIQRLDPHRPAWIAGVTSATDVQEAVRYARDHALRVAVQGRGHGHTTPTDGVLITTGAFAGVSVDPRRRTAAIQPGATWQQVIDAAAPYGLAPLSGSFPGVGAVSYTLGGGTGLMARRYGFAADHVRRLELVTPDGELRTVTPEQEDLFWALRGGGGNFGIVTALEVDLFEVPTLAGGSLYYDLAAAPDVLATWHEWTRSVPDEVTSAVAVLAFPDIQPVPAPLRGKHVAQLQLSMLTGLDEAERLIAELRAEGEPLLDTVGELPFTESHRIFAEPDGPSPYRSRNVLLRDLEPAALATVPKLTGSDAPVMTLVAIRHLGGAMSRPPATPNAIGHRDALYSLTALSVTAEDVTALLEEIVAPWAPYGIGRSLNFSFAPLTSAEVAQAYEPSAYARLRRLRQELDPTGLLQPNHPL
ncbi:FAD-binding oxidoreductase [Kribbella flavida]|nr:FAD-binding oxidoreductase [Kribbella flavida]